MTDIPPAVRLHTLGTFAVRDARGADLTAVATRSKEAALLVYLALAGRRGAVRRDRLLALFWPELSEARARGALSQALYRLRHSLADDTIVSLGKDDVTLGAACWCDAAALLDALDDGRPAQAIEHYGGDFLPGVHLAGLADFEDWAAAERDRLRRLAADAAGRLAEEAEAAGDAALAARWLRRKVDITPTDESAFRELMRVLDRLGDRAGAVRAYEELAQRLARAYELEPAPETRAQLDAVRNRRHVGEPGASSAGARATADGEGEGEGSARSRPAHAPRSRGGRRIAVAAALLVLAAGWVAANRFRLFPETGVLNEGSRILVADPEGPGVSDLSLAVREALVTDLDQSLHVRVVDRVALAGVLARMGRADTTRITAAVALEIARRDGHAAVLSVEVRRLGTGYQLAARILDATSGQALARERETAVAEGAVIVATERLSRRLRRRLGESLRQVHASPPLPDVTTPSLEALTFLARAREHAYRAEWRQAVRLAEQAVEADSAFAAAHTALVGWNDNLANPTRAERHAQLAYRYAARLSPRERLWATARFYGHRGWLDSAAHYDDRLLERDPTDYVAWVDLGNALDGLGREEEALAAYRRALALAPQFVTAHNKVLVALRELGRERAADSVLALMHKRFPDAPVTRIGDIAVALRAGDVGGADRLIEAMRVHESPDVRLWGRALGLIAASMRGRMLTVMRDADEAGADAIRLYGPHAAAAYLRLTTLTAVAAGAPEGGVSAAARAEASLRRESGSLGGVRALGVVGAAYVLGGDAARANRVVAHIDSVVAALGLRSGVADEVRAVTAWREGRARDAVHLLSQARDAGVGGLSLLGRFVLADAYDALGDHRASAAGFAGILRAVPTFDYETFSVGPLWPIVHERLGQVYEALGDSAAAIGHWREFATLWRDADAELQPRVAAARAAIGRLSPQARR